MANAAYPLWLKSLLDVWMNLASANPAGTLRAALLTSAYTYSEAHEFYSSISGELATAALASVTTTGGILDAADTTVSGIASGAVNAVVLYWSTGVAATSRLMLYFDDGIGFDVDPAGNTIIVWPDDATSKIFPLGGIP